MHRRSWASNVHRLAREGARRLAPWAVLAALAVSEPPPALADARAKIGECVVSHARLRLGDLIPTAPDTLRSIDLGPSPLAGSSRVVTRAEIVAALPAGASVPVGVESIRVVRKTSTVSVAALEKLTTDTLAKSPVPKGGTLVAVRPSAALVVPDGWDTLEATLPRLPRKAGKVSVSAAVRFVEAGQTVMTTTVPVELMMPESAAIPDVKRGAKALLVVRRGNVEVRAVVAVGADADLGDEVSATVKDSGRVVRGKLVSTVPATLEEIP